MTDIDWDEQENWAGNCREGRHSFRPLWKNNEMWIKLAYWETRNNCRVCDCPCHRPVNYMRFKWLREVLGLT